MPYSEKLSDRIREALMHLPDVEEKHMFGGVCYMVNGKMCVGIVGEDLMCRIGPEREDEALSRKGCRPMDFTGRTMRGYVYVDDSGMKTKAEFDYWINLCLAFNETAKAASKKKKK
jgi:TfoX/Sxy family transcriptional regulator of competence genes